MNIIQDGGLSCVRHFLEERGGPLEALVQGALRSPARVVGTAVCVCSADSHWETRVGTQRPFVRAVCGCNGSVLPVYLGAPPENMEAERNDCPCPALGSFKGAVVAVGIGYPVAVPPVGTIDAERAVELLVASECVECRTMRVVLHVKYGRPPEIRGDEPWIRRIQGLA